MNLLDPLNNWGIKRKITDSSASLTVAEVNARMVLMVGRNGEQVISVPNSTRLAANVRVLAIVDDANVSPTNYVTITDGANSFSLTATDEALEIMWTGSYWRQLAHSSGSVVSWSLITGKPSTILGYGITDAVAESRQVIAGAGLSGGGDLSADRTLTIGATDATITVAADGIAVSAGGIGNTQLASGLSVAKLGAGGTANRVLATTDGSTAAWAQVSDAMISGMAWSKLSSTPTTLAGYGITDAASSSVIITAGAGLTGGGNLTTNRTINVAAYDSSIGVNADGILVAPGGISNTHLASDAAVAVTKLALGGANQVLWSNGAANTWTGTPTVSTLTATTSVTSPILNSAGTTLALQRGGTTRLSLSDSTGTFNFGSNDVVVGDGYVNIASTAAAGKLRFGISYDTADSSTMATARFLSDTLDRRLLSMYPADDALIVGCATAVGTKTGWSRVYIQADNQIQFLLGDYGSGGAAPKMTISSSGVSCATITSALLQNDGGSLTLTASDDLAMSAADAVVIGGTNAILERINGATKLDHTTTQTTVRQRMVTTDELVVGSYLSVGASPAGGGTIRLPFACSISTKDNGGTDQNMLAIGAADGNLILGDNSGYYTGGANKLYLRSAGGTIAQVNGVARIETDSTGIGFFAATPVAKPTVTGSRGSNAALADLLTELANLGLITNSTTA